EGVAVADVLERAPTAGERAGSRVVGLIRIPAGGGRGEQKISAAALEDDWRLTVPALEEQRGELIDLQIVRREQVQVQVVVLVGRGDEVGLLIVIDEQAAVARHVAGLT